ncbi:ATP-dependent RNA helicase TDRD9-like [Halichondria panicea]|uniref:ATP-dependent RNA helicase TDRD9-like n=1 Tax=Halichondria panicea TaxID=6063 RepID=UPI00312B3410
MTQNNCHVVSTTSCQLFNICGKGKALHFETFKVFVEFERPHSHSRSQSADTPVLDAVLIALKRRQERNKLALYIDKSPLPSSQRNEDVPVIRAGALKEMKLPDSGTKQIVITEYIDAGHFWAQLVDQVATTNMRWLLDSINTRSLKPLLCPPAKMEGMFCLSPFSEDGLFYRAKVVGMEVVEETNEVYAHVVFVDYGNVEMVNTGVLCELSSSDTELDMQAIECFLTSVKPTIQSSSDGKWSAEANDRFKQLTMSKYLMIQVYSRVGNSLRVDLYDTTSQEDIFINEVLVKEGHAVHCEEPYPSKFAHVQTLAAQASEASTSVGGRGGRYESSTTKTIPWVEEDRTKKYPRERKFELRGPDSMYEVTFHQMTIAGGYRQARIERDSVNCIVVNSEPQDRRDRLMVAGYVALNPSGNTCIARHTTLMPNIPALLHLVAILFAPCVEMRANELKRQYTGAICGLGFDVDTDESIYSEHDMELTFDTLISQDDLKMVNNLRLVINLAVWDEDVIGELNDTMLQEVQTKARNLIKELILKPRDSITPYQGVSAGWNKVRRRDILRVDTGETDDSSHPLFPLHLGINISEERIDQQRSARVLLLREAIKELHKKTSEVFVEFERPHSHSRSQSADTPVLDAVLIALKRRQERNKLAFYIDESPLPSSQRNEDVPVIRARALKEMKLPDSGIKQIVITEYIDAGHFWAQLADQVATTNMRRLLDSINTRSLKPLLCPPAKMEGMFCLAPFSEDGLFYRAKVVGMEVVEETNEVYAHVVFVDYGNVEMVNTGVLCELSSSDTELDMQAIECFLTSVKPTIQSSSDGKWSAEANDRFKQLTMSKYLMIQVSLAVYSYWLGS